MTPLIRLLKTTSFRLALIYLGLFVVSVIAVLGYVYWNTSLLLARQTNETIEAEIVGLAEQYHSGGLSRLLRTVADRSQSPGESVYLLVDPAGQRLGGNLLRLPQGTAPQPGWVEFDYRVATNDGVKTHRARARLFALAGGFRLAVGRDIEALRRLDGLVRGALAWALGLTLVLGLGGGVVMSRNLLKRVEAISAASASIMAGNLAGRMPLNGSGDEMDRLAASLNAMLDEIERLMGAMREVTDNIAHDLRTPLTRLRARLEDGLRQAKTKPARAVLDQCLSEAEQVIATFQALLKISALEARAERLKLEKVDLGPIVASAAELYEPVAEEAGISLSVDIGQGLEAIADRQLIAQAIANLIDNAIKYSGAATGAKDANTVVVAAHLSDGTIEISVSDAGQGIAPADRARVFSRFVRLDQSRGQEGSGLGLSLVSAIAHYHGGEAFLTANPKHQGVRAGLRLPVAGPGSISAIDLGAEKDA
ncbi:MAG: HAMP domain-containing sensor histidine kinase [Alphaproteobacteria bacterium]